MTQFSNTPLLSGSRPQGGFLSGQQLQNAIQTDSLQVFNVPAVGAINQGNNLSELRQAFGLTGQVAQGAGQISAQERAKKDTLDAADAATVASLNLVDVAQSIDEKRVFVPDGQSATQHAKDLVEAQIATEYANKSDAWKKQYRESIPHVAGMLRKDLDNRNTIKNAEALNGFSELAYQATDASGIDKALSGARSLGLTEQQVYAGVILPGLKTASAAGNKEAFDRLVAALPESQFKQTVDLERAQLQGAMLRKDAQQQQNALAMFEEIANSQPPEVAADALRQMRESGTLSETNAAQAQALLDKRAAAATEQAGANAVNAVVAGARTGSLSARQAEDQITRMEPTMGVKWANSAREAVRSALSEQIRMENERAKAETEASIFATYARQSLSGGPVAPDRKIEFQTPDGRTHELTPAEIEQNATDIALGVLSQGKTPEQARVDSVKWAQSVGKYPKQFVSLIDTAPSMGVAVEDGKPVPPALLSAVALYEQGKRSGGVWVHGLGNEKSRAYLDAVVSNMQDSNMTPEQAVRAANRTLTLTPEQREINKRLVTGSMAEKTLAAHLPSDVLKAANYPSVQAAIVDRAATVAGGTNNPSIALSNAAKDYAASYVVLGQYASPTNQPDMTPMLRDKIKDIADGLARNFEKKNNHFAGSHSLVWEDSAGLWRLNDELGRPAIGPGSAFTTAQLAAIANLNDEQAAKTELESVVKNANKNASYREQQRQAPLRELKLRYGETEGQQLYNQQQKTLKDDLFKMYDPKTAARLYKELGGQ